MIYCSKRSDGLHSLLIFPHSINFPFLSPFFWRPEYELFDHWMNLLAHLLHSHPLILYLHDCKNISVKLSKIIYFTLTVENQIINKINLHSLFFHSLSKFVCWFIQLSRRYFQVQNYLRNFAFFIAIGQHNRISIYMFLDNAKIKINIE